MPSWRRFGQGTGKVNAALHGLATHNYSLVERNDPTHNLIPLLSYRYSSNIRPYPLECLTLIHHQTIGKLSFKQLSFEGSAFRKSVHRLLSRPAIDQMGEQRLSARNVCRHGRKFWFRDESRLIHDSELWILWIGCSVGCCNVGVILRTSKSARIASASKLSQL